MKEAQSTKLAGVVLSGSFGGDNLFLRDVTSFDPDSAKSRAALGTRQKIADVQCKMQYCTVGRLAGILSSLSYLT